MSFISNTDEDRRQMLETIGVDKFEDLLDTVPEEIQLKHDLDLPDALSELEVTKLMQQMASLNADQNQYISFLGGGAYDHFSPAAINHMLLRSEFYTAYTPYQPEVSQGTLQVNFEYQTMMCELTGMDVSNASLYNGASAAAEASLVAQNLLRKRNEVVVAKSMHPNYIKVVQTYNSGFNSPVHEVPFTKDGVTDLEVLKTVINDKTACVIVQHPNFFGSLEDVQAISDLTHEAGALFVAVVDPISLPLVQPPGRYDADIAVGEGHSLGSPANFGGPHLGFFTCKDQYKRKMPGRVIGQTVDREGKRAYVMTLRSREQDIRREKATSNICTNQGLVALAACVYMCLMGKQGMTEVANQCVQKSHYLADQIKQLNGYELQFSTPFFKEFVVKTPVPASQIIKDALEKKIHAGIALDTFFGDEFVNSLLICVTEKRTKAEMETLVELLKSN